MKANRALAGAFAYLDAGKISEAISEMKVVSSADPRNPKWHACLGELSVEEGLADEAEAEFDKAGQCGAPGMTAASARVHANRELFETARRWRRANDLTGDDLNAASQLLALEIPGSSELGEDFCDAVVRKASGPGGDSTEWINKHQECMGNRAPGKSARSIAVSSQKTRASPALNSIKHSLKRCTQQRLSASLYTHPAREFVYRSKQKLSSLLLGKRRTDATVQLGIVFLVSIGGPACSPLSA